MNWLRIIVLALVASNLSGVLQDAESQVPPSLSDIAIYAGLHHAAYVGDVTAIRQLVGDGAALETRDSAGRTALHLAAFQSHDVAVATLAKAGANVDAFEDQDYDIISIAAVADDVEMVRLALALGGNPGNVTRVRTHYSHQMTAAARAIAAMKFLMLRSKRVAIWRQSLRRQNMRSMMLRCL